ncbi:MAG: amino acid adenylation domain-containing protein [Chloroflexi bacterium]|nr:amino acid adenylation domain-containing protein [Chloroflexota bacterium]
MRASEGLSSSQLRLFLQSRLPEYMVPTAFVFLDRLPVTPSGKINRRALPAPDQLRPELADAFIAPRTPIEEMLAQIWAEVLRVDRVGAHDSFFELGGHSLMATQVISRVREVCQVELPLRALFEAPTVAGLAERVANAGLESPDLAAPPIVPVSRDSDLELSFAQQRLWFFDQLQPESAAYNISNALHFEGELDVAALEQSLNEIVRRHDSLRTIFAPGGDLGQPIQIILPFEPLPLAQRSLDFLPANERFAEAVQMAADEAERPFDLQRGPLLRTTLLHLGPNEHVLLLNMHHIVSDGWSMGVFMREMTALYNAFAAGERSPLPNLLIQYVDYAVWQRNWLQGDVLAAQLDYWKQQLAHVPSLQMPTDYPRPAVATLRGAVQEFALPKALGEALTTLSRREGATLFMTLLTAWQVLLSRYSGQDDIAVGTPIANRTRGEVESLIGYFINTLVLRTDLTGAANFREALQRVRTTALGAYAHQDLPFEQIVDAVQPERDLSRHAIFQVMFVLQNAPMDPIDMPGLRFKPLAIARSTTRFDLTLTMAESPNGLTGVMEYSTDLFSAETIARLIGHFQTLLTSIAAQPAEPLAQLSLLTPGEERQLLVDWNATAVEYPQDACVHTLFAEQAARTPDAIAVSFEGLDLSYAELDARSNQMAHYLQALGVGPDTRVGVFMERSLDLVVGLLGILKAGGAYLPLDPSYPADRLSFMVADSAAPVLLTQRNLLLDLPEHQAQIVCVDVDWPTIAKLSAVPVASAATPDNLAYVIYTSGSTGKPKGVMVPHRGVVNFFVGMDQRIGDPQPGAWLAVTSISFDISVLELFWTLTRGFRVVVQREADYSQAAGSAHASQPIEFSLFYFASDDRADIRAKYRLLMEGAKFADRNGFTAVWTPERHFHEFGGLYPNPSVTSAALAAITERVQIRAGSVVLPLHNPIRVAEEWSVVDNMSNGRVGISFASGWHADDFVFAPEHFKTRKKTMLDQIETVRQLWRGDAVPFTGGAGNQVDVRISPRPVQADLPIWLTASGAPETFQTAGALGIGVLTHLLGQSIEQLAEKIALYRAAWHDAGHPGDGHVTLMLHTFVGKDMQRVREIVREPFTNYLRTSLDLIGNLARSMGHDPNGDNFSDDDMAALLEHAFERYFETSSLMGTPEHCLQTVDRLKGIGVDEVACLIDFGVEAQTVLDSLDYLTLLKERSNRYAHATEDYSLLAQLSRYGISHLQCTPSMANMLLLDPQALTAMLSLRKLMLGGEALPIALAQQLTRALPAELHNMYGPTETTIWSTTEHIQPDSTSITIGTPIANTEIYILDRYFQPTPVGIPGDLLIGGDGLVRGYLNRPELTAERFVPNPFSVVPGQRLYKTGDLARYRHDGTIEYLGRVDTQVKIRGYRIEVSEIEAVLGEHPDVREAVVVARDDAANPSDKRLVAYIVAEQTKNPEPRTQNLEAGTEASPSPAAAGEGGVTAVTGVRASREGLTSSLRQFLESRLPAYMVPSVILELDAFPLTPNGKVDRKALPAPDQLRPDLDTAFVAPQTPVEQLLANIWADVLRVGEVGVTDNFFSLGGNSLLATLLVSRMREAFQVDLPVRTLFEAPTIAGLSQRIVQARTSDSSLLPPPIVPVPRDGTPLPLSFAQQRLWFIHLLQPDNPAYNEPTAIRVSGPFNQPALERTIATIIGRHEALRTTFMIQQGEPVQIIHPLTDLPLEVIDLQHVPEAERDDEARRISREQAHHLFDLERGPLFRVTLLRLSPEDHVILLLLHHIISDGWSNSVIIQELKSLYNAEVKGEPVTLPELTVQYADYALWQRDWLKGEVMESHLDYWKQQLAGVTPMELPTDHPRPSIASFEGAVEPFALPVELRDALNMISRREGVTLFMTMLTAFQMLLSRYSGQDDIAVGTPIAGRNMRETETMLGFFINTLVLRTDLSGDPSFRAALARVREVALGAYTHQDLPFEQVVDAVQPERDLSRQPLFQVIFALQNAPAAQLELEDLTISPIAIEHTSTKFDLDLSLIETPEGIFGSLHYSTDLFEVTTIRRMLQHFTTLLKGIAADPDQRLSALPMLAAEERRQLLTAWNPPATEYPRERCVHTIVAEHAANTPDALAVIMPGEQATYAELNTRANQLAHQLQSLGVGVGTPVAICLDRSLAFVVGVLAISKAGGAYVPLDPGYPAERLQFMLADTAAPVLITTAELAEQLPEHAAQVIRVDSDAEMLAAQPTSEPISHVTAEHLAYLIYTSGSTGQPKGIGIPHRAITRLVCNTNYVQFTANDRIALLSNVSFDAATMELWGALLNGGCMVGVPREVALSPQAMAAHIREYRINTLFMTTALFNQMAREAPDAFAPMRDVLFGGEAVDPRAVAAVLAAGRPQRLLHVYGPTESTTYASWYEIGEVPKGATTIPIGYPLAQTQLYVLDATLQPVPVGVPGELLIGGDGLAHGYLNQPALTAEKFVPDSFSGVPGARLYRTGDVVRYTAEGAVEFIGRRDHQVKLRGFRIELGEIEAALLKHASVGQVAVLAREDEPGQRYLAAYLVPNRDDALNSADLRQFLQGTLPDYMIPSAFVILDALPLTPNGKLDRKAFPVPDQLRLAQRGDYVEPRDVVELKLVQIWEEVLNVKPIGAHDNFFDLGGHSLLVVRLMSRIQEEFGRELSLATIFQQPTIEALALELRDESTRVWSPLVPIQPRGSKPPMFLVHPAGGTAFCYVPLSRYLGPDQPVYGFQAYGLEAGQAPYSRIEDIAAYYLQYVREIQPEGPYMFGGWSIGGVIAFEMAQQLRRENQEVALLALMDSELPPPDLQKPDADTKDLLSDANLLMMMVRRKNLPITPEEFRLLSPEDQLRVAVETAKRTNIIPPDAGPEQVTRFMQVLKGNFKALIQYKAGVYPDRLTFLATEIIYEEGVDILVPEGVDINDPARGWSKHAAQPVDVHMVPGDHTTMLSEPHVRGLAEQLSSCIAAAQTGDEMLPTITADLV